MKLWLGLFGLAGVAAGFLRLPPAEDSYIVFLAGDSNGYLSPCGCSDPMMGGAKRRATAIKKLGQPSRTFLLENGGFVKATGRQDEIKIETFAELHKLSGGAAINLASVRNCVIRNNVIVNDQWINSTGIALWDNAAGTQWGCKDNLIEHNTVAYTALKGRYAIGLMNGSTGTT